MRRRFLWRYYGFQFFFNLLLWLPVYYDFQKRIGLNDAQIFGIQTIYYLAFCVLEIPTGHLADRWGHRSCMKLGAIVLVVANLVPVFALSYWGMLGHFLLISVARSLISGAASAYLYDYLRLNPDIGDYKQTEGAARAYGLGGKVVFWAGIGALMEWHLTLPYLLTALSAFISLLFAWGLPPLGDEEHRARPGFFAELKPLLGLLRGSPRLVLLMLQGLSIFVLARICQVNLFQPILTEKGFSVATFGMILALNTVFEAVGSAYPHWLRRWLSDEHAVSLLTFVLGGCLSLTALSGRVGSVVWLSVFALAVGLAYPIQRQLLNDAIPEARYRATFLSVESLIDRVACAAVAAVIGGYVALHRLDQFLHLSNLVCSSLTAVVAGLLLMDARSARRIEPGLGDEGTGA
ncbi:MAG TPA: MFS transporter [Oscillatoriaceae cyanobacterium]